MIIRIKYKGTIVKAFVDKCDVKEVLKYTWYICKKPTKARMKLYAATVVKINSKPVTIGMASIILKPKKGQVIDHKNGDTLDNRRKNIRVCTWMQNVQNQTMHADNILGIKGVSYDNRCNRFYARICVNYKIKKLGYFETAKEAADAYDAAALKFHKKFAKINQL